MKNKILLVTILILSNLMSCKVLLDKERYKAAEQELKIYSIAIEMFYEAEGKYPKALIELFEKKYLDSKHLDSEITDPWHNKYIYLIDDKNKNIILKSLARDNKEGGEGFDKDIVVNIAMNE